MKEVQYFKAAKNTHRFNANQKVWIALNCANHMRIWFRWRGRGRYVSGVIDKWSGVVSEIKTIEVEAAFAKRIEEGAW